MRPINKAEEMLLWLEIVPEGLEIAKTNPDPTDREAGRWIYSVVKKVAWAPNKRTLLVSADFYYGETDTDPRTLGPYDFYFPSGKYLYNGRFQLKINEHKRQSQV